MFINYRPLCDSYAIPMRFLCDSYAIPMRKAPTGRHLYLDLETLYLDFPVIPQAVYVLGGYRCTLQTPPAYMFSSLYPLDLDFPVWSEIPVEKTRNFTRKSLCSEGHLTLGLCWVLSSSSLYFKNKRSIINEQDLYAPLHQYSGKEFHLG